MKVSTPTGLVESVASDLSRRSAQVHYSGRIEGAEVDFDSTYDAKKKKQNPLCVACVVFTACDGTQHVQKLRPVPVS